MSAVDIVDLLEKAGTGAALVAVGGWSLGRFNNAMSVSMSAKRSRHNATDVVSLP